ncbi:MAG: hypothetical protein AAGK23_13675 [Pseudomonadota bacterium]
MNRWWIIFGAAAIIGWFGLKDIVYRSILSANTSASVAPLDYTQRSAWAYFPEEEPAGAWETPWGVDIFLIGPPTGMASVPGLVDATQETALSKYNSAIDEVLPGIPADIPVYAPLYHSPSAIHAPGQTDDIIEQIVSKGLDAAFETYLDTRNRQRGIILVVDDRAQPFTAPISEKLTSEALIVRFGGRIILGDVERTEGSNACSPARTDGCEAYISMKSLGNPLRFLAPRLPGETSPRRLLSPDSVSASILEQVDQLSTWLDENAPKPAEPLGDFEEIEIAPLYRPGDSDPIDQSDPD